MLELTPATAVWSLSAGSCEEKATKMPENENCYVSYVIAENVNCYVS